MQSAGPRLLLGLVCWLSSSLLCADTVDPICLTIEQHFAANEIEELGALEIQDPQWFVLQQFRLAAAYIPVERNKQAVEVIREGLSVVAQELSKNPEHIEMLILGAMLDGQYLLVRPWRFIWNGRRGLSRIGRAEKLAPDNPRIALVRGTAKFILPRFLGGSAAEAEAIFQAAIASQRLGETRFDETTLCQAGEWGQVDIMNWLARAYTKQGDTQAATLAYQKALEYSPGNYWVQLALEGEGYEWTQEE